MNHNYLIYCKSEGSAATITKENHEYYFHNIIIIVLAALIFISALISNYFLNKYI